MTKEKDTIGITIQLRKDWSNNAKDAAESIGLSLSGFIRMAILEKTAAVEQSNRALLQARSEGRP